MALVVKINSYDISNLVQAAVDEFDPANAFNEPQFAGNSLTDGDLFISMTRRNREWSIPLLLIESSNDNLAATVRTINSHLKQGVTLEYREDGATNSTYFDVESATLEADYKYQRNRQGVGKFLLKVWTRPLGHTGTTRVVATAGATGYAVFPIASMGLSGDANARLRIDASAAVATGFISELLWGYTSCPTYNPRFAGTSGLSMPAPSAAGLHFSADNQAAGTTVISSASGAGNAVTAVVGASGAVPTYMHGMSVRVLAGIRANMLPAGATLPVGNARFVTGLSYPSPIQANPIYYANAASSTPVQVYGQGVGALPTGFITYDLGIAQIPNVPEGDTLSLPRLAVVVTPTTSATPGSATMALNLDEILIIPHDGGAVAPSGYIAGRSDSGAVQWVSLDGANASVHLKQFGHASNLQTFTGALSLQGELPNVDPGASGALVVVANRRSLHHNFDYYRTNIKVSAREQFQFFR